MNEKPPILPYQSPRMVSSDRPVQTPVRNQIYAAIYSVGVVLKWIVDFLRRAST